MSPLKIAVLANSQATGFGRVLRYYLEENVQISAFCYNEISSPTLAEEIFAQLAHADVVFAQEQENERVGSLRTSSLRGGKFNLFVFPPVVFQGFHPDMTLLKGVPGDWRGPLHTYHSRIIAAGFLKGFTATETFDLFNAYTYARVGYFDAYLQERDNLIRDFHACGIDIVPHFERWVLLGPFMYTFDHAKLVVTAAIAEELCKAARLPMRVASQCVEMVIDNLQNSVVWPVYPEIAKRHGFSGGTIFKGPGANGEGQYYSLDVLVEAFFECYRAIDPAVLQAKNVQKILEVI